MGGIRGHHLISHPAQQAGVGGPLLRWLLLQGGLFRGFPPSPSRRRGGGRNRGRCAGGRGCGCRCGGGDRGWRCLGRWSSPAHCVKVDPGRRGVLSNLPPRPFQCAIPPIGQDDRHRPLREIVGTQGVPFSPVSRLIHPGRTDPSILLRVNPIPGQSGCLFTRWPVGLNHVRSGGFDVRSPDGPVGARLLAPNLVGPPGPAVVAVLVVPPVEGIEQLGLALGIIHCVVAVTGLVAPPEPAALVAAGIGFPWVFTPCPPAKRINIRVQAVPGSRAKI